MSIQFLASPESGSECIPRVSPIYESEYKGLSFESKTTRQLAEGELQWDAGDRAGRPLGSGIYIFCLKVQDWFFYGKCIF
jgi:hypothetical protein